MAPPARQQSSNGKRPAFASSVHSIGMLGRLFCEVIEDMDFGPVEALNLTGASRLQAFAHAVASGVPPSLLGIGFRLLTAMNLFQYRTVSLLLVATFILVMAAERGSALLRRQVA